MGKPVIREIPGGSITSVPGFRAGAVTCGLKSNESSDLAACISDRPCTASGVFTRNRFAAAPVLLSRDTLRANPSEMRGVIINAGYANACTGPEGLDDAQSMRRIGAEVLGVRPDQVLILSTGVIGVRLPMDRVMRGIAEVAGHCGARGGVDAARAIMTTDTRPKHGAIRVELPEGTVTLGGIAKGSGMIHPDMATMLALLTTDADVPAATLERVLRSSADKSFNCISVDGDTSTNDAVIALANGQSGVRVDTAEAEELFRAAFLDLCLTLAKAIVRDGEGAKRVLEIQVVGALTDTDAAAVAQTVATSPLVKTAVAGGDPNWGRILAAAGRAGVPLDPAIVSLSVRGDPSTEPVALVSHGRPTEYRESDAASVFQQQELCARLDLGMGRGKATVWTTDLTHEYVTINADYRS